MNFTDQQQHIATKEEVKAPWSGYKDGSHFYCKLCGHKFEVGDKYNWVDVPLSYPRWERQ